MKFVLNFIVIGFIALCCWLIIEAGLFKKSSPIRRPCVYLQSVAGELKEKPDADNKTNMQNDRLETVDFVEFSAVGGPVKAVTLGSLDSTSGFKFKLELSSEGASIAKAVLTEFDDRDPDNPQPLALLSPVRYASGEEILSIANREFVLIEYKRQLALDKLSWKCLDIKNFEDGSQVAQFEAIITTQSDEPVIKLTKTFKVTPGSFLVECILIVENLTASEQQYRFNFAGPVGIGREAFRTDARKVIGAFKDFQGQVNTLSLNRRKLAKAETLDDRRLRKQELYFLWAAVINKYFTAILVPLPDMGEDYCDWVADTIGSFYNPDRDSKTDSGDETIGFYFKTDSSKLSPANQPNSSRTYRFQLYLGPKDKTLFDKNEFYRKLGFFHTIDFMPCFCCPAGIINPLAFGILAIMKWMHSFIGNYGIVIIILVFLMRLIMHPITKKSQVSMSKMSKLAPMTEEIKKKYANNKAEMNKQLMALYKEQGASPIMGMLPMMLQMPIWFALYGAVYSSIDLRGAPFLPFWITDLSAPDALVRFSTVTVPFLGWKVGSLNLLPILMGLAFYLQQKLMPSQAQASPNPQLAQQQKMMMIMMPLFFPLVLYNGPSGVNLYIMASTFAGVIEQHVIRKHIKKKEEQESKGLVSVTSKTGGKVKKRKPKPFFKF